MEIANRGAFLEIAAPGDADFFPAFAVLRTRELAPGLAILAEAVDAFFTVSDDFNALDTSEKLDGQDVPGVFGSDVGDEEVDVFGGVDLVAGKAGSPETIAIAAGRVSGLDLNAPGAGARVDDEVIVVAVAPGFGDGEAELRGLVQECGFGDLAATLASESIGAVHWAKEKAWMASTPIYES